RMAPPGRRNAWVRRGRVPAAGALENPRPAGGLHSHPGPGVRRLHHRPVLRNDARRLSTPFTPTTHALRSGGVTLMDRTRFQIVTHGRGADGATEAKQTGFPTAEALGRELERLAPLLGKVHDGRLLKGVLIVGDLAALVNPPDAAAGC